MVKAANVGRSESEDEFYCRPRRRRLTIERCLEDYTNSNAFEDKRSACWRCPQGVDNRRSFADDYDSEETPVAVLQPKRVCSRKPTLAEKSTVPPKPTPVPVVEEKKPIEPPLNPAVVITAQELKAGLLLERFLSNFAYELFNGPRRRRKKLPTNGNQ